MIHIYTCNVTCKDHHGLPWWEHINQAISSTAWTQRAVAFYSHSSPWQQEITLRADKLPFKGGFFFFSLTCHWLKSFFFILPPLMALLLQHLSCWFPTRFSFYPHFIDMTTFSHVPLHLLSQYGQKTSWVFFSWQMGDVSNGWCVMLLHPGNGCYPWQEGL